jgi:electron transfer flavoprotein beta subunit
MLNIIVCIKVVTDPEAPVSTFRIDPEERRAIPGQGVPPVLNPYDENSLEAALRIKDVQPARITIISAGKSVPKAVIKKSLAVGADDLVVLEDDSFIDTDANTTACILTAAIRKLGEYDLILTGRMAADTNAGEVGPGIAELLNIPSVTVAQKVEINNQTARVERSLADGYEALEVPLPCLVTVSHEIGELRAAAVKGLIAAQKQPFTTWSASDLGIEPESVREGRPAKLYIPERTVDCEIIAGDTPEKTGATLALKLRESKRI